MKRILPSSVLSPAVAVAVRFGMRTKLILLGFLLLFPLLALTAYLISVTRADVATTKAEIKGVRAVEAITSAVALVQEHRDQLNILLAGNLSIEPDLSATRSKLVAAMSFAEHEIDATLGHDLAREWRKRQDSVGRLAQIRDGADRKYSSAAHRDEIEQMRHFVFRSAESSGLLLDHVAPSYLLMDMMVERVIPWAELMAHIRGRGAGLLNHQEGGETEAISLLDLAFQLEQMTDDISLKLDALKRTGEEVPKRWVSAQQNARALSAATRQAFASYPPTGDSKAFFAAGTASISAVFDFRSQVARRLESILEGRVADAERLLVTKLGFCFLTIGLLTYFLAGFYRASLDSLANLSAAMATVATGDLSVKVEIAGRDEIARTGQTLERMVSQLSELVAEVRSNAELIGTTGRKMVDDNQSLSDRTQSQTRNLEEAATSIRSVSEMVAQNAAAASHASDLAHSLVSTAGTNRKSIDALSTGMEELQQTSRRMNDILGAIDSIAFQTNILALNASVEASRAGDHGRGFAVVAFEVRQLAKRCQGEASAIRKLIQTSADNVDRAVSDLSGVRRGVDDMLGGIQNASIGLQKIAAGSMDQSVSLEQVVQSIGSLDELAQQNGDLVTHTSERAYRLLDRASALENSVKSFRVRQGTAAEAKALVERAAKHIADLGWSGAILDFQDATGKFIDRDLYLFSFNRDGVFRLSGPAKEKIGKNVYDIAGQVQGRILLEGARQAADQGGGWANYAITNPLTGAIQPKSSWIVPLDNGWLLGCGFYVREIDKTDGAIGIGASDSGASGRESFQRVAA